MNESIGTAELSSIDLAPIRAVVCDLDGTLAESKEPCTPPMLRTLEQLLDDRDVGIISGGRLELIEFQVLSRLNLDSRRKERLHLLPASGTQYRRWRRGAWKDVHNQPMSRNDVHLIEKVLTEAFMKLGYWESSTFGQVIDDRGGQVTYSALGQHAPPQAKKDWDPDGVKKTRVIALAQPQLPHLNVAAGKSTSIDVTRVGFDKGYGVNAVLAELDLGPSQLLFFGDRLDNGGNDAAVLTTQVPCIQVTDWRDTLNALRMVLRSAVPAT